MLLIRGNKAENIRVRRYGIQNPVMLPHPHPFSTSQLFCFESSDDPRFSRLMSARADDMEQILLALI